MGTTIRPELSEKNLIVGMFTVTNDLKNDRKNRSVSYRSYRKGD